MYCTQCGTELTDQARFCTACGAPVDYDTNPQVDDPNRPTANKIKDTGASFGAKPAQNASFTEALDDSKKKSKRKMPLIVLIALALALASGLAFAAYTVYRYYVENVQPPIATVEQFTQAVSEQNLGDAVACMDEETRNEYESAFSAIDSAANALGLPIDSGMSQAFTEDLVENLFPGLSDLTNTEVGFTVTLENEKQIIDGNSAHVSASWRIEAFAGAETETTITPVSFNLELEWGSWKIINDDDFSRSLGAQ